MKISNLLLTFILALVASLSLHSQSNSSHVISMDNDNETIYIEYNNGEITLLKVNDETIDKSDYSNYKHIFNQYEDRSRSSHSLATTTNNETGLQPRLHKKIRTILLNNENINLSKYEFKLTRKYIKLNGKKLSDKILDDCLDVFKAAAGYSLTEGSYFHVDISPNSRSISLSLEN